MALARRHELNPLKEPEYEIEDVPRAAPDGTGSAATRITDRNIWIENLAEMILLTNRAGEDYERKAAADGELVLHPGKPLSLEYVADRLDTDDPLWGWTLRTRNEGWLQGYIAVTTFTTWQRWFRWDSLCEAAWLLPVDRTEVTSNSTVEECKTQEWWDSRLIDGDGRLARALNRQIRDGDWTDEGVIWPRVAEISLLGALGCGGLLLDAVIEELGMAKDRQYDYIICQATENAVPFYESRGFVRVGAIARYEQKLPESEYRQVDAEEVNQSGLGVGADDLESMTLSPGHILTGTSSLCDWIVTLKGDTPSEIAKRLSGVRASDITFLNRRLYPGITENSLLIPGTRVRVPRVHPYDLKRNNEPVIPLRITSGDAKDILLNDARPGIVSSNGHWYNSHNSETIRRIATRFGIDAQALAAFNKARYGDLKESSVLQEGTILWLPNQPIDLKRLYALAAPKKNGASKEEASKLVSLSNGTTKGATPHIQILQPRPAGRGRPSASASKKGKKDETVPELDEDPIRQNWYTDDERERSYRQEEMRLHEMELSDPKLLEFYSTERCDDISIIEGRQTKKLSEVMAYRHWTFPDEPAALTAPSYMMVLSLNKAYLEQHVPSIRKKRSALSAMRKLQEEPYPIPPYVYGFDEKEAEAQAKAEAAAKAVAAEAAAKAAAEAEAKRVAQSVLAPPNPTPPPAKSSEAATEEIKANATIRVSLRSEAIKTWRHGPYEDAQGRKVFLKGSGSTPSVEALLPNGPLKPRPPQPPKRPSTSFLEFCAHERPAFIAKYPNKIPREITILLTDAWKKATPEAKLRFEKNSEENRERYHAAMEKYRQDLKLFHEIFGLDEREYDLSHPECPRLRKVSKLHEAEGGDKRSRRAQGGEEETDDHYDDDEFEDTPKVQRMLSDRLLKPNQPRLFNKVVTLKPKRTAAKRAQWLELRSGTSAAPDMPPPPPSTTPPPPMDDPVIAEPPEDRQYYFTLTYIPDLQWCRLAPIQEAGVFLPGVSKKKGYERHVGRTRYILAPESVGREIDVSASRCVPVSRAFPVKNTSDADKEEWDIIDEPNHVGGDKS